jgi:hypothetical protein
MNHQHKGYDIQLTPHDRGGYAAICQGDGNAIHLQPKPTQGEALIGAIRSIEARVLVAQADTILSLMPDDTDPVIRVLCELVRLVDET